MPLALLTSTPFRFVPPPLRHPPCARSFPYVSLPPPLFTHHFHQARSIPSNRDYPRPMEGYLGKRGKRMGSRVKRYMRLEGAILSNHHTANESPTWRVDIKDAIITCNTKRNRIIVELFSNKLELFAESSRECEQWYTALTKAQHKQPPIAPSPTTTEQTSTVENNSPLPQTPQPQEQFKLAAIPSNSLQDKDANQRTQLGKNFKVVKPQSTLRSDISSAASDDAYDGDQLIVQGQVYEETPASMIFKQFNFPSNK